MTQNREETGLACEIVRDLLPLYYDGVVSEVTRAAVAEHLEQCAECRGEYEALGKDLPVEMGETSTKHKFADLLHQQKRSVSLKVVYVLTIFSLLLPWFTYNARIMGYCWGYYFLRWFALPLLIIAVYLFTSARSWWLLALTELGLAANLVLLVIAFGRWQEVCNIIGGFQWKDGLHTAQPGYGIAAGLFVLLFVLFQYDLWKRRAAKQA